MSVSLYYSLTRSTPLTSEEYEMIDKIVQKYSDKFEYKNIGEDFYIQEYDEEEPEDVFGGSTKLPFTDDPEDMLNCLLYWCDCLAEIRKSISGGEWSVNVDDAELDWDEQEQRFVLEH